jgi:NAD(P)-dependent dehydrogenase (short-subunit alcohol dehydrogenase family)
VKTFLPYFSPWFCGGARNTSFMSIAVSEGVKMALFDIGLGLQDAHVLVTGSSGAIGSMLVEAFLAAGAYVSAFDIKPHKAVQSDKLQTYQVNITDEKGLEDAFATSTWKFGLVTTCVMAAGIDFSYCQKSSIVDYTLEEWQRIVNVNVNGTFLTCRTWLRQIKAHATPETRNISGIVFGSESGTFGVPNCASYATTKSAIQYGLVKSLARDIVDIHPRGRVNAIAPGPVATKAFAEECERDPENIYFEAQATIAMRKPVPLEAVARACLFLASENFSGNITSQVLPVDSGKSGILLWPKEQV